MAWTVRGGRPGLRRRGGAESQVFGVGAEVEGYLIEEIAARSIDVSLKGYGFTVVVPKPADPTFGLVKTEVDEVGRSQAWIRLTGDEEEEMFAVGAVVEGYRIESIGAHDVTVSRVNYEFTVSVPKPADPSFAVTKVKVDEGGKSQVWAKAAEGEAETVYGLGDAVDGYVVKVIGAEEVTVSLLGYDWPLAVPPPPPAPPDPTFAVVSTVVIGEYDGVAWVKLSDKPGVKVFRVGEMIEEYRLTKIEDGAIKVRRGGFSFTVRVPVPEPKAIEGGDEEDSSSSDREPLVTRNEDGSYTILAVKQGDGGDAAVVAGPPAPAASTATPERGTRRGRSGRTAPPPKPSERRRSSVPPSKRAAPARGR